MNKIKKISEDFATSWEDFFISPSISQEYWIEIDVPYMAIRVHPYQMSRYPYTMEVT